jgi:hypothetical protein
MIHDVLKKKVDPLKEEAQRIQKLREMRQKNRSFDYTFTAQSGFDEQFKALPTSIQKRMIRMWYDNGQPTELVIHVERWNPERRPGMGMFEVTPVFSQKSARARPYNDTELYERFRKQMITLSGTDL